MFNKQHKGFTLIELLVVISIISLLSSVVLTSVQSARVKARDAQRISLLREYQKAIELYRADNGSYPNTGLSYGCFECTSAAMITVGNNVRTMLTPYFPGGLPKDPKMPDFWSNDSGFLYRGNANSYCIENYRAPENMNNYPLSMRRASCATVNSAGNCGTHMSAGWDNRIILGEGACPI